jgi:NTE family protein
MTSGATPTERRVGLVLGGGGIKGFAHIGVMLALRELGIRPALYAGTSIGSLLGAAAAGGMSPIEMQDRAESLRRRDLFRINHVGMLMDRMRSRSIYLEDPLRALVEAVVPGGRFDDLEVPMLVNTVDLERGTQVVWGTPGLTDASVQDAVYASCALPGFFPPGRVNGRFCVDGGVIDNLPAPVVAQFVDVIIAVDVGSSEVRPITDAAERGFANIYMRAASTMMHALQDFPLRGWQGPPMILIRPRSDADWLSFTNTPRAIREGYRAAMSALEDYEEYASQPGGIHPRRRVVLEVIRQQCVGCRLCVSMAPGIMGIDSSGKAFARTAELEWSPADGDFVHHCPTSAIIPHVHGRITRARPNPAASAHLDQEPAGASRG